MKTVSCCFNYISCYYKAYNSSDLLIKFCYCLYLLGVDILTFSSGNWSKTQSVLRFNVQ